MLARTRLGRWPRDELVWVQTGGPHKSRNRAAHKERFVCAQTRITFLFAATCNRERSRDQQMHSNVVVRDSPMHNSSVITERHRWVVPLMQITQCIY